MTQGYTPADREYLLRTVLGEAARQPEQGQAAVAHVVLNRLKGGRYGNNIRSVVTARSQFEPWNDPVARKRMLSYTPDDPRYQQAARVVDGVLSGEVADPTGGADHFLNEKVVRGRRNGSLPSWANEMWGTRQKIGDHTFLGGVQVASNEPSPFFDNFMKSESAPAEEPPAEGRSPFFDSFMKKGGESSGSSASKEPAYDGPVDGAMRAAQDGVFLGHGDNVGAFMGAVAGADPESGEFLDYSRSFGDRYSDNLSLEREKRGEFDERNKVLSPVMKATGAVGAAVAGPAIAGIKGAATVGGRIAQASGGGAVIGAIAGSGEADGANESRLVGAGVGATGGAVGGLVGVPLAAVLSRVGSFFGKQAAKIFSRPQAFNAETGQITEEGARQLKALGLDPARVSDQLASAFAKGADEATAPRAAANSFGIPLTKGQATGDVPQIASEEAARAGARGQGAYDVMTGFDKRQGAALGNARDSVVPNPSGVNAVDAAEMAIPGIKDAATLAKMQAKQAYDVFEANGGGIRGDAVKTLARNVVQRLKGEALDIDPSLTNASQAMTRMQKMLEGADRGAVPFSVIERTRQMLRRAHTAAYNGSNGADQEATRLILSAYDDWMEDAVDYALQEGAEQSIAQIRQARTLWADYLKTFTGKKGADNYIRKIVEDEATPDQVAGWLFGASKNIGGGQSAQLAKRMRDVLGADSQEFTALKKAAWDRLTMKADTPRGVMDMESALREFTAGKGKTLAAELFTPKELTRISEFRMALKALIPPAKATNPSGSGYEAARSGMALMRAASASLGFASGGPGGAVAGAMAPKMAGDFSNTLAARAAVKGITGPPPSLSVPLSAAAASGSGASGVVY